MNRCRSNIGFRADIKSIVHPIHSIWCGLRCEAGGEAMAGVFPGAGKKFLVDFQAFKVLLDFSDEHSLTYYSYRKDGSVGEQETVSIETEQIAGNIYLVRWQESDKT